MKTAVSILLLFICSVYCFGQKSKAALHTAKCDLTLKDAPVLSGLRLGMPHDKVLKKFEVNQLQPIIDLHRPESLKDKQLSARVPRYILENHKNFRDVESLEIYFFENEIYGIKIKYSDEKVKFDKAQPFAQYLSVKFDLPFEAWTFSASSTINGTTIDPIYPGILQCRNFSLYITFSQEIVLSDPAVLQKMINIEQEAKRKQFK